jgi:predicted hydrocarbon binding protein
VGLSWILKKLLYGRVFDAERGRITLFGRMDWILIPSRALAMNIQMIGEKNGEDFLYKLGYEGGKQGSAELIKYMGLKPRGGWVTQKAIVSLLEFLGYGKPEFVIAKVKKDGHHRVVILVRDNPVIEHAARMYGSKSKVCSWFMGIYAAHGEMELGLRNVQLKENKCLCKGKTHCEWETRW